jgi:hypothetical protein
LIGYPDGAASNTVHVYFLLIGNNIFNTFIMPSTCCCVPKCSNREGHVFPKNEKLRKNGLKPLGEIQIGTNFSIGNL